MIYTLKEVKSLPLKLNLSNDITAAISQDLFIYNLGVENNGLPSYLCFFDLKQEKIVTQWKLESAINKLWTLPNHNLGIEFSDKIEIWNLENQQLSFEIHFQNGQYLEVCDDLFFVVGDTCTMERWDIMKNKCLFKENIPDVFSVTKIISEYFVVQLLYQSSLLEIYEQNGKLIKTLEFPKEVQYITKGLDQLIISFVDGTIQFWGGA